MRAEKISMRLTGTRPLLMHSSRLADPLDEITKRLAKLTAKRPKTEADHREIARVEWHGGLWLYNGIPCIPAEALQATFRSAAKTERRGQQAAAGILIEAPAPLKYDGPPNPDELWLNKRFSLRVPVKVGRARTNRTRARFPEWSVEFDAWFMPSLLNRADVVSTYSTAGFLFGLGDWRPNYGTFLVEEIK
jgi:hypothetical protein